MGHDHSHAPEVRSADDRRRLVIAIVVIGSGVVLQFTGALLSGSLALLADSAHMLSDLAGLVIALVAVVIAAKPPTPTQTFGRRRVEVLAAMANALMLGTVAIVVAIEAIGRLVRGEEAELGATVMLVTGIVGGLCNLVALLVLSGGRRGSINLRGAYLEVMGDLLGSVAVVAAAVVLMTTGFASADSIASLLIAALIVPRAYALLADVVRVLSESVPRGTDLAAVREHILQLPGVRGVHDVHAWQITPGETLFSAHVVVDDACTMAGDSHVLLDRLDSCLREHFDVVHPTFQIEAAAHEEHEVNAHR